MEPGTRRERGWRLTKASWRLARRDPTLVPLTLLALGCTGLAFIAPIAILGSLDGHGAGYGARILLVVFGGAYAGAFVLAFLCAAVAHAASAGFEGEPLTMREAIGEARLSLGPIALWSLIAAVVTIVVQLLRASGDGGELLGLLIGLLWGFFVAYVIPVIALAGAGAAEAIEESAGVARRRWGEQLSGAIAIFVLSMLAVVVFSVICALGIGAVDSDRDALGGFLLVIGVLGLLFTAVLSFATTQAFLVALFRYDGGELSLPEIESPPPATPIGGSPVLRVAGIIAGLLVAATLVGALLPHDRNSDHDLGIYTPENGYYYATFGPQERVPLSAGSPVLLEGRQVGVVIESRLEPSRVVVWFRADPALEDSIEGNAKRIGVLGGTYYLQVGPQVTTPQAGSA